MEKTAALIIILICTVRVISYGIYTKKDNNKTGAAGLFVIAFLVMMASVYYFIK
jgi:hypothetical protein